jgi:uncharacterized membrane protein (UPF0182 family)
MKQKLTAPRALTALVARRAIRFATFVAIGTLATITLLAGILAYFFSAWWWLLTVPFIIFFVLFLILRIIVLVIVRIIHDTSLTSQQRNALNAFTDKIQAVLEARATPPIFIALVCMKDLLLHRDIVTVKKLIKDTSELRKDYAEIEKLF